MNVTAEKFQNWMPYRVYQQENRTFVDWCYMGAERFTDSFFDETIERRFRQPFNLLFQHRTPIEFLGELNTLRESIKPSGFIFHMSRCGSTLVSQMLGALEQNIVLSEPPPIDSILRSNQKNPIITDEQRIVWLQWLVSALGQKRNTRGKHFFIKFDSWSMLDFSLIERAFPDVPWVFLYRNPVEVIVSQMRQRGAQMIPGAVGQLLPGLDLTKILQMPPEEYCARVIKRICESAIDNLPNQNALPINYTELPEAVSSKILGHFRLEYSDKDLLQMTKAAQFDAKTPQMNFVADAQTKQKQASPLANEMAEKYVNPVYEKLESLRLRQINLSSEII